MKVREIMTSPAIRISPQATVEAAARTLTHYNIGILPVCTDDGTLCGLVTDRDLVTRCMASGRMSSKTTVQEVMTGRITAISPDMSAYAAAQLMGSQQIRRLPVVERGKLTGMVSLGDLAKQAEMASDAADALVEITSNPMGFEG